MGHRHRGHYHQRPLDQLPEVVLLGDLHRDGLGMHHGDPPDRGCPHACRLCMAAGRRYHLHHRRRDLRTETADLQLKAQKFRLPRDLPSLRHGRKLLPLHDDVWICGSRVIFLHTLISKQFFCEHDQVTDWL